MILHDGIRRITMLETRFMYIPESENYKISFHSDSTSIVFADHLSEQKNHKLPKSRFFYLFLVRQL